MNLKKKAGITPVFVKVAIFLNFNELTTLQLAKAGI
jgi:hypothetical protein